MFTKGKFKVQYLQEGGMVQGPSHAEGGVDVYAQGAPQAPVAEVEGGERVFSREQTQVIEQAAMQIVSLVNEGREDEANQLAMELGYAVINMIAEQEMNAEQQMNEMQLAEQANTFAGGNEEGLVI